MLHELGACSCFYLCALYGLGILVHQCFSNHMHHHILRCIVRYISNQHKGIWNARRGDEMFTSKNIWMSFIVVGVVAFGSA